MIIATNVMYVLMTTSGVIEVHVYCQIRRYYLMTSATVLLDYSMLISWFTYHNWILFVLMFFECHIKEYFLTLRKFEYKKMIPRECIRKERKR